MNMNAASYIVSVLILKKYKTFSVLIYSYINTSGNWKSFRVFPIFMSVDITISIRQKCFIFL